MAIEWSDDALAAIDRIGARKEHFAGEAVASAWRARPVVRVELADLLPFASRMVREFGVETLREVFEGD